MKVLPDAEAVRTDEFFYDLETGYINPKELVDEESAKKVHEAMAVLKEFEDTLQANDLIRYY